MPSRGHEISVNMVIARNTNHDSDELQPEFRIAGPRSSRIPSVLMDQYPLG